MIETTKFMQKKKPTIIRASFSIECLVNSLCYFKGGVSEKAYVINENVICYISLTF